MVGTIRDENRKDREPDRQFSRVLPMSRSCARLVVASSELFPMSRKSERLAVAIYSRSERRGS